MKLYTAAVVAEWLDISERRVRQLRDQKVLEEARPKLYRLKDCVHRYIDFLRKDGTPEGAVDYNQERAKLEQRVRELNVLYRETKSTARMLEHYYDRRYHKNDRYTF